MVDSVQTLWANDLASAPGSVAQVREAAGRLLRVAKEHAITVILVGHVTKDGAVAGPRVLEHLVDAVLMFEGDRTGGLRVLRAAKNRFGSTAEIGVFEMTSTGLAPVGDPSALLGRGDLGGPGSVVACAVEGTRPLLLEVQALVAPSDLQMPRRLATGVDRNRLAMILAVLQRHAELPLGSADVFVNVAGGVDIDEPAADLAIALAIASAAPRPAAPARWSRSARSASPAGCAACRRPSAGCARPSASASRTRSPRRVRLASPAPACAPRRPWPRPSP